MYLAHGTNLCACGMHQRDVHPQASSTVDDIPISVRMSLDGNPRRQRLLTITRQLRGQPLTRHLKAVIRPTGHNDTLPTYPYTFTVTTTLKDSRLTTVTVLGIRCQTTTPIQARLLWRVCMSLLSLFLKNLIDPVLTTVSASL